ncbi:hypothetical protein AB4076_11015 [Dyella sp. 2RAF44]|uniref:hypothetical protein n=1 Tax=Dyella sp. 2RAF44 TaxID=3233000 RepID=UPI003F8E6739
MKRLFLALALLALSAGAVAKDHKHTDAKPAPTADAKADTTPEAKAAAMLGKGGLQSLDAPVDTTKPLEQKPPVEKKGVNLWD